MEGGWGRSNLFLYCQNNNNIVRQHSKHKNQPPVRSFHMFIFFFLSYVGADQSINPLRGFLKKKKFPFMFHWIANDEAMIEGSRMWTPVYDHLIDQSIPN